MIGRIITLPFTATVKAVRVIGVSRVALLGAGAAVGALVTPVSGPELRRRIAVEIAKRRSGTEETVEDRVRDRLAASPRTWHLPQPEVVAVASDTEAGWRIILAGTAPDDAARQDLGDAARVVTGVIDVDNRVRVEPSGEVDESSV